MKINWKIRAKNKMWLSAFISAIIVFIFTMCRLFSIETPLEEYDVMRTVEAILTTLVLIGVLQDPTSPGIGDDESVLGADPDENIE